MVWLMEGEKERIEGQLGPYRMCMWCKWLSDWCSIRRAEKRRAHGIGFVSMQSPENWVLSPQLNLAKVKWMNYSESNKKRTSKREARNFARANVTRSFSVLGFSLFLFLCPCDWEKWNCSGVKRLLQRRRIEVLRVLLWPLIARRTTQREEGSKVEQG